MSLWRELDPSRRTHQAWQELHRLVPETAEHNQITGYLSLYKIEPEIYRAGVALAGPPAKLLQDLSYMEFGGGKFSRFVLTGPYSGLGEATSRVMQIVEERKLPLRNDYSTENYVNNPGKTPEEQLITEILLPTFQSSGFVTGTATLVDIAGWVLQQHIREQGGVERGRQMWAEADAHIKRRVEVEADGRTKLVHGFAGQADKNRKGVAVLFDSDALGFHSGQGSSEAKLRILHECTLICAPGEVDHAHPVLADHGLFGIIFKILPNHQDDLAIAVAIRVEKGSVGRERNVPGHFSPQKMELITRVPDVVSRRVDRVLPGAGVITRAAWHHRAANVRLALKYPDRGFEIRARSMKIRGGGTWTCVGDPGCAQSGTAGPGAVGAPDAWARRNWGAEHSNSMSTEHQEASTIAQLPCFIAMNSSRTGLY